MQNYTLYDDLTKTEREAHTESRFLYSIYLLFTFVNIFALLALFILAFGYIYISGKTSTADNEENPFDGDHSEAEFDFPNLVKSRQSI